MNFLFYKNDSYIKCQKKIIRSCGSWHSIILTLRTTHVYYKLRVFSNLLRKVFKSFSLRLCGQKGNLIIPFFSLLTYNALFNSCFNGCLALVIWKVLLFSTCPRILTLEHFNCINTLPYLWYYCHVFHFKPHKSWVYMSILISIFLHICPFSCSLFLPKIPCFPVGLFFFCLKKSFYFSFYFMIPSDESSQFCWWENVFILLSFFKVY